MLDLLKHHQKRLHIIPLFEVNLFSENLAILEKTRKAKL